MASLPELKSPAGISLVSRRPVLVQGVIAGALGATVVALWFLVVDFARGRPFFVPAALGHALLHGTGLAGSEGIVAHVVAYTIFHYVAFIVVGMIAAFVLRTAEREPTLLAGAFLLFAVFEIGFYLLSSVIAEFPALGAPAGYLVAGGNLLAAAAMGFYLWRANPGLARRLDHALSGGEGSGRELPDYEHAAARQQGNGADGGPPTPAA